MSEFHSILDQVAEGNNLSQEQSGRAFQMMMTGGVTPAQIGALLIGMKINGETVEEITGAAMALRKKMKKLPVPEALYDNIIDTCGTGGDGLNTYNISTTVAFVLAGCGVPVAKHGNKAVSSKSGSADVLTALGVEINVDNDVLVESLERANVCFMMAPKFHSAMRHVAPARQEMKLRTIFNLLGPLINPAMPKRQIMGVYSKQWVEPIAHVLKNLGAESAWVVHGLDGLDEISLLADTFVAELKDGQVRTFTLSAADYGFEIPETMAKLTGGDAYINAQALKNLLSGAQGPYTDTVLLNSAAGLVVAGLVDDIQSGIELAKESIASGAAKKALHTLVEVSNLHKAVASA